MSKKEKSIRVCYKLSDNTIVWGNVVEHKGTGNNARLIFDDGGWLHPKDGFFTEDQCRKYHRLPPKDWEEEVEEMVEKLDRVIEKIKSRIKKD